MANVSFKRGLASALTATGFTAQDGVFYLTTDSHRLYVGQNSELVELNRYVKVVATTDNLPSAPAKDDFAFVTAGNMLLVCKDPSAEGIKKWTQINSQTVDTDTDTTIAVKGTPTVTSDATGVTISFTFSQTETNKKNNNTTTKADIPVSFKIASSDIATANSIAVAIGSKAVTGGSTIAVSGAGSTTSSVTLKQGSNVTITDDGSNNITISAVDTKYSFGAAANKLNLTAGSAASGSVSVGGDDYVSLTADATDGVKAAHKTYAALAATKGTAISGAHGGKFTIVSGLARDDGGHLTGYTTQEVTLPSDNNTTNKSASISANNAGDLTVSVTDSGNNAVTGSAKGALYFTVNGDKVFNQGAIDFYTKSEIDGKINGINAMVYRGTVGDKDSTGSVKNLPTSGVAIGDTYMAAAVGTFGSHSCKIGDLLIATGTEVNGVITSGLTWTYVPSGDDTDTHYTIGNNNGTTITLTPSVGSDSTSVALAAGTATSVTGSANKITIGHANVANGTSAGAAVTGYGEKFNAVTGVTVNAQGHVTNVETTAITMPPIQNVDSSLSVGTDHAITLTSPNGESAVKLVAGNDTITMKDSGTDKTITIGHKTYNTTLAATPQDGQTISSSDRTFTAVTNVKRDATGHLSEIDTTTYTLPVDNNTTYKLTGSATATENVATIKNSLDETSGSNNNAGVSTAKITSGSLAISAANNIITMDLQWGSF